MRFRETSNLLTNERLSGFQFCLLQFKKYLLFPICIIISLLLLYALSQNGRPEMLEDSSTPPLLRVTSPFQIPEIIPISELMKNSSYKIERFSLVITKGKVYPDNTRQEVYLVNGQYPGPVIRIQQNSILILTVTNRLNIPITIHVHGIHQRGTFLSDGVPLVTQDPIPPGGTFTHSVNTWPQAGTFFYHAHTGMDIVWIAGPLIIEDDPTIYSSWPSDYQYDEERIFFINGIYHNKTLGGMMASITGPVFRYPRVDSVIINGRGHGLDPPLPFGVEKPENVTLSPSIKISLHTMNVESKRRYRFRFISSISDGTLRCKILGHKFTVIEMDGIYSEPVETDSLVISPGQRYSLIVLMDQNDDNYFLSCKHLEITGPTGLSIIKYARAPQETKTELKNLTQVLNMTASEQVLNKSVELSWILDSLTPNLALNQMDVYRVPEQVDQEFMIDVEEVRIGTSNVYLINGHLYQEPSSSYHHQLNQSLNITHPPQVFEVLEGEVIQIIFQNQRLFSICFGHPWHLHGHSFYVVGHGPDKYDPLIDGEKIKENVRLKRNMQFRDTVTLNGEQSAPETEHPQHCGWTAIRYVANNPGLWLVHCHVTPHMLMGKRFLIWEHSEEDPFFKNLIQLPTQLIA